MDNKTDIKENIHEETETIELTNETIARKKVKVKGQVTAPLVVTCVAVPFGTAVLVGYHLGVVNAPADYMRVWCNETVLHRFEASFNADEIRLLWAIVVSIFLIGGCIGSFSGGWLADKFGRKISQLVCTLLFLIGGVLFACCRITESIEMLLLGRLIVGLASGLSFGTTPMYLAEISPISLRGSVATIFSVGISMGVCIAQLISLDEVLGTEELWHYALSVYVVFILVFLLPYPWFPESPKYLYVIAGDKQKAKEELKRLRGNNQQLIEDEIVFMSNELNSKVEKRACMSVLTDPTLTLPLILVCAMQAGQQFSGINAVDNYSVLIFESAGISSKHAKWANLAVGFVAFAFNCLAPVVMSKLNRRPTMMWSCGLCGLFLISLTLVIRFMHLAEWLSSASIAAVVGYLICFQLGLGPLPPFIGSELFESEPRSAAMALGAVCNWAANFISGMAFPILQLHWQAFVFIPYATCCFSLLILLKFYLPETRGRDPSEVAPLISQGLKYRPVVLYKK